MRRVALVAGERLIAAVSGQGDGHVPARLFGDQKHRQGSFVAEGLVERSGESRQRVGDVGLDRQLLVHRPVSLGHGPRVVALVVARVPEPDGERAHGQR